MTDVSPELLLIGSVSLAGLVLGLSLVVSVVTLISLYNSAKERRNLNKEIFGLLKKIEGLTASRREQMLKHYDGLLETLGARLPTAVASHTSHVIFETESKILARLAELEPNLKEDQDTKEKFDDLIKSMEGLEKTIVNLTSEAVRKVMVDGRRALFEGDSNLDLKVAA